ncbi:MAG: heavy metal transport/detoxification protein [Lachnospiraceae bacterium]|jgi:copper chaperone CopZ|nr:heavy metal transport/detoxification protein [Anaerocolumna sp.]MDF2611046.1 heavy metal transport/detoxification protein [Lachnospiraceae bacterium]
MNTVQYNVNGLLNTQIKTQLKNVLDDLDGVHKVNIDLGRSSVEVEYKEPTKEEEIRHSIEHVGCKIE